MGKLVTIATKARFDALREASKISETSLNFILETGLLYTHNIFINGASFGTETSNYIPVKIGGVTKNLSLDGHTHSNYYDNSSDIDIGSNKIKSGTLELLKYSSDTLILGNSSIPTEFYGTLKTTKDGTKYTILDTNNFSIVNKTSTNLTLNNVALFKYGSSSFQLDYVRRYNTVETFNNLTKYTSAGTTNENSKAYGFITLSTDTGTNSYSYALIRVNIPDNILEFRTSSDTNWKGTLLGGVYRNITINGTTYSIVTKAGSLPTILAPTALGTAGQYLTTSDDGKSLVWRTLPADNNSWRPIAVNGTEKRSSSTSSGNLDIINGTNTTVEWTSGNKLKINSVNTWTAWKGATESANGTAGYMPAPTSTLRGQFLRGDGTWVSLNNYSLPTASSSTLGGVKTGAAITDTTGYTAVAIKDGIIYYKDTNTTYSFSNLLFLQTSGTNLMTYNSQATRTVLAGSNITFTHSNNILTITAKDTTYSTVSKSVAGLCPALPNETTTTKYLRLDGTWVTPPNDNTWKAANASQEGYVPKSTANKILRANADGALYWGDDANTTYTFYNLLFQNSGGTTVDTYKPTTSPTKTLKAGANVTISAASNVITIASTNTWNANAVGVAGYVAAPTKAANANMTWLTNAEGVPAWRASNNHTHSYLPLSGGTLNSGAMIVWLDWGQWEAENPIYPKANGGLQWSGTSDTIKLFAEETASDDLRLVLLFGDDATPRFEIRDKNGNANAYITNGGAANFTALTVNNTAVSLSGHKHAYTDLTGSSTTANQAIVSNGTANGWTLKTLGSRAFDSTSYLPLSGGTLTGNLILKGSSSDNMTYSGNVHPYIRFDNSDSSQNVSLIFTDYDSYRSPAGLKLIGNLGNEWFEAPVIYLNGTKVSVEGHNHNRITSLGNKNASDLSSTYPSGLSVAGIYNNGYPFTYGSTITANGNGGHFQIAGQWNSSVTGSDNYDFPTEMYIRGRRDSYDVWTTWTRVLTNRNWSSVITLPTKASWNYDDRYVSSLTTNGNSLRWVKNGSNNDITIPYATNADMVDNVHLENILTYTTVIGNQTQNNHNFHSALKLGVHEIHYGGYIANHPSDWEDGSNHYGQMLHFGHAADNHGYILLDRATLNMYFKNIHSTDEHGAWYKIAHSGNSSVSKSGETLTIKINGTSLSLTNTWRGIQNNLTSDSTTDSLSAAQGKALANGSARDNTKLPLTGGTMSNTNVVTNLNADLLDGWHLGNILQQGYITSGTANLSSYWAKVWEITITNSRYGDYDLTLLVSSVYSEKFGIIQLRIRQNGENGGGAYAFSKHIRLVAGNIPLTDAKLYCNNSTGKCELWMNVGGIYGVYNVSILKKCGRVGTDVPSMGELSKIDFSTVQTPPSLTDAEIAPLTTYTFSGTATKAIQDSDGNTINSTYLKKSGGTMTGPLVISNGVDLIMRAGTNSSDAGDLRFQDGSGTEIGRIWLSGNAFTLRYSNTDAAKIILHSGNSSVSKSGETLTVKINGTTQSLTNTNTTYSANNGVGLSGTTFYNSGVRSTTINGNYLRVNTNGTDADLTIPYATSAGSASNLTSNTRMDYGWNGINYFNISAANQSAAKVNDTPYSSATWTHILRFNHGNNAGYYTDLAIPFNGNGIYYKRIANGSLQNSTTNGGWISVLDNLNSSVSKSGETLSVKINGTTLSLTNTWRGILNNLTSDSTTDSLSAAQGKALNNKFGSYLPLSGGTLTGNLSFSNSGTGFRGINYGTMGDNDQWRIGGAATGSNAGYMEIATADDGNEPIYVRQYTGVFSTLIRTLTLLDASGNTSFPGKVTATTFNGTATGNVTALSINGNYLRWTKNGTNTDLTIPYATSAGNGYNKVSYTTPKLSGSWVKIGTIIKPGTTYIWLSGIGASMNNVIGVKHGYTAGWSKEIIVFSLGHTNYLAMKKVRAVCEADNGSALCIEIYVESSEATTGHNLTVCYNKESFTPVTSYTAGTSSTNAYSVDLHYNSVGTIYANIVGNATSASSVAWANVSSKPETATRWPSWSEVSSKPETSTRWPTWSEVTSKPTVLSQGSANGHDNTAGLLCMAVSNPASGDVVAGKYGSVLQWANNPGQTPSTANSSNWYNQLFGLTDDRLYFRTRTNGGNWTSLHKIAWTSDIPTKSSWNYDDRYLKLSGGTLTGTITCVANYYVDNGQSGINMNNSDLVGCNSIRFGDTSDHYTEALMFYRSNGNWDSFRAADGTFYFGSNNGTEKDAAAICSASTNLLAIYSSRLHGGNNNNLWLQSAKSVYITPSSTNTDGNNCFVFSSNCLLIRGATTGTMNYSTSAPRIVFSENGQLAVGICYTDWDSYRPSKGIKIMDTSNDETENVWLEALGCMYATNFYTTSDLNKKKNITILSEHIRKFQLKSTEKWHYGVIALEVPEMFREGLEGNMTVNYNSVLSYYVGSLENSVASLKDAKQLLENKIKELENRIKVLEDGKNS